MAMAADLILGPHRLRLDRATQLICVWVLHDKRFVCYDCFLAPTEQGKPAHQVAFRSED